MESCLFSPGAEKPRNFLSLSYIVKDSTIFSCHCGAATICIASIPACLDNTSMEYEITSLFCTSIYCFGISIPIRPPIPPDKINAVFMFPLHQSISSQHLRISCIISLYDLFLPKSSVVPSTNPSMPIGANLRILSALHAPSQ